VSAGRELLCGPLPRDGSRLTAKCALISGYRRAGPSRNGPLTIRRRMTNHGQLRRVPAATRRVVWCGPYLWGPEFFPSRQPIPESAATEALEERIRRESTDSHLRSTDSVSGYKVHATDESRRISREYENSLHLHYGRAPYWIHDAQRRTVLSMHGI
jgi:hypothetical protein